MFKEPFIYLTVKKLNFTLLTIIISIQCYRSLLLTGQQFQKQNDFLTCLLLQIHFN